MIRVELLGQRRSPWSKALLAALVVCGGLYGIHRLFPALAGSLFSPAAQQESTPSPVVQQESTPKPDVQQEAVPSPAAQQEAIPSTVVQQESTPKPDVQQEATPSSQEAVPRPGVQQEATPSTVVQQEIEPKPDVQQEAAPEPMVVQREAVPSPDVQQEATSSPVQETAPKPAAQQETDPSPVHEATPTPASPVEVRKAAPAPTPSQASSPQRSTACHQVMRIDEQVPAGVRVASLNCNSTGDYWLEGTSPSHKVLRIFRLRLQALPSQVSFSVWQEGRTLRFAFQGRFAEQDALPLAALSSDQAEQFLGKVARWADASGLDSLSIHAPIHTRTRQRQKLHGLGSPQQIDAFLHQLQQAEAVATLGEVLLMPVQSDERGWVKARLYAAVDILVEAP